MQRCPQLALSRHWLLHCGCRLLTQRGYKGSGARSVTQQNNSRLPHTRWWEKPQQAVPWPAFCNLNACRGTVIGGADGRKVGFSLSDCCRGSYAFVFRRFEHHQTAVCSVACDASSNRGGLGFRHVQIAKRWVSLSAQKRDRLLDSLERPGSGIPRAVRSQVC